MSGVPSFRASLQRLVAGAGVAGIGCAAFGTVTPGVLFGDSYLVQDGGRTFSVIDVYIQCGNGADVIGVLFGAIAHPSDYAVNNGKSFAQSSGTNANSWLPTNDDGKEWDSFVTCGARVQGSSTSSASGKAGFLSLTLDQNWSPMSTGSRIEGQANGAGWYPAIGAGNSTNPYSRANCYAGTDPVNTAKTTSVIAGNGVTPGQSLTNYWMVGRFAIDVTEDDPCGAANRLSLKFAITCKQNGVTTVTGATSSAGRFECALTFASTDPGCVLPECPADLDGNRVIDTADGGLLLLDFGSCAGCPADLDGNSSVDTADLSLLLLEFGDCPPCVCP